MKARRASARCASVSTRCARLRGRSRFRFGWRGPAFTGDAASLAAAFERFHLLWFDEPCRVSNLSTLRKIASETVTPLGLGRTIHDAGGFQDLLREQVIDVLRPSLAWNGLSQIRKMAALAESYYVAVAPFHDRGPMGTAAALTAASLNPYFFIEPTATARSGG